MPPPPPPGMAPARRYSLFQRSVRVVQTSVRRLDWFLLQRMPGLPNPPEMERQLRQPRFVDLWEFTLADHARHARLAWREYRASFEEPSDADLERSKQEVRAAVGRLRGSVGDTAGKNLEFLGEQIEGTRLQSNLEELRRTSSGNAAFLRRELEHAAERVDADAVLAHARAVVEDARSQDDVATTVKKNVAELAALAREGRAAALRMDRQDVERAKTDLQAWFADKLVVGQDVLLAFIRGYREGKRLELEREDALLLTAVRQAAEEQKELVQEHLDRFLASQREKQRQDQLQREEKEKEQKQEAEAVGDSEDGKTPDSEAASGPSSTAAEQQAARTQE